MKNVVSISVLAVFPVIAGGQSVAQPSIGSYTEAQAAAGQVAYASSCAECHLADLRGGFGPPLVGLLIGSFGLMTALNIGISFPLAIYGLLILAWKPPRRIRR